MLLELLEREGGMVWSLFERGGGLMYLRRGVGYVLAWRGKWGCEEVGPIDDIAAWDATLLRAVVAVISQPRAECQWSRLAILVLVIFENSSKVC